MEPVAWIRRKAELHLNVGGEPLDSVLQGPQVSNFLAGGGESTLFLYVGPPPEQGEEEKEVEGKESGEADSASGGEAAEVKQSKTLPSLRTQTDETAYLQASLNKPPPLGRDVARAMYFIRNDSVPLPEEIDATHLDFGVLVGHPLANLANIVRGVQDHLFPGSDQEQSAPSMAEQEDRGHAEMRNALQRFGANVQRALEQVSSDLRIDVPVLPSDPVSDLASDVELCKQASAALTSWTRTITTTLATEAERKHTGPGPAAEIEFWRGRQTVLSTLAEQLSTPAALRVVAVAREAAGAGREVDKDAIADFDLQSNELTRMHEEAVDNVKFLSTLERHFKNIGGGDLATIAETIPSLMSALRMVWIISRHYNTDQRMTALMTRTAGQVADKVSAAVQVNQVLRMSAADAVALLTQARDVLHSWSASYFATREKIEQSGTDFRWEFDRKLLFDRTQYMAGVCDSLLSVATTLDQFTRFLGPELSSVTGDSASINALVDQVHSLARPVQEVAFDVFDRRYAASWDAIMAEFHAGVETVEARARDFIDTAFRKLRSSEGAFQLLEDFRHIKSRDSIKEQMQNKMQNIVQQYGSEVEATRALFLRQRADPPKFKNFPPLAGRVAWAAYLFHTVKKPIVRFHQAGLLKEDGGDLVKEQYIALAKDIDAYIQEVFDQWCASVQGVATNAMRESVLRGGDGTVFVGQTADRVTMPPGPYRPNFSTKLRILIKEAQYMDKLGFQVPKTALNVAVQEHKFLESVDLMQRMLDRYEAVIAQLSPVESRVMVQRLRQLKACLKPGFVPLNWSSLHVPVFIQQCNEAIANFENMLSQVRKSIASLRSSVTAIADVCLLDIDGVAPAEGDAPMELSELMDALEAQRARAVEPLVDQYQSMNPLFVKIEETVADTATGESQLLQYLYTHIERAVYNAILTATVRALATVQVRFFGAVDTRDHVTPGAALCHPLCNVRATLSGPDIVLAPTVPEIQQRVDKLVERIVGTADAFTRWMRGTCKLAPPKYRGPDDDDPITFTFLPDVANNPEVVQLKLGITQAMHGTSVAVERYLRNWHKYKHLWDIKKFSAIDQLRERPLPAVYFEYRLAEYARLDDQVRSQGTSQAIAMLSLDTKAIAEGVRSEAAKWRQAFGSILRDVAIRDLDTLTSELHSRRADIERQPHDLKSLKQVLNAVAAIAQRDMDMELEIAGVREKFATLHAHQVAVPGDNSHRAGTLAAEWRQLFVDAKTRDLRLLRTKEQFKQVTAQDAIAFDDEIKELLRSFLNDGPTSMGAELDEGVVSLQDYKQKLEAARARREELTNAQDVFGLPVSPFNEVAELGAHVAKADKLYGLYRSFTTFVSEMSSMLWAQLDASQLTVGVDEISRSVQRAPKEVQELGPFGELKDKVAGFRESIPLIQSLKNDAMKERHWASLMEVTGVQFDMNPKTFTLANLFEMRLNRFAEEIGGIVNQAMQEVKIENEMGKIKDYWTDTNFTTVKYFKGDQARGVVLGPADEVQLALEDHLLNLQTMAASSFVGIFVDEVKEWDQRLNVAAECIEIWFKVQNKWMYLESIFVGSEDIRQQLPEAAKRFDTVDKTFRGIMQQTVKKPNVVAACTGDNRVGSLEELSERLDQCQKSLSDYLDTKRNSFPRFFFLSDDELLSVLGSSDPRAIQVHLLKLFANCKQLDFARGDRIVQSMESSEGEAFQLRTPVPVEGPVEVWMTAVATEMRESLWAICKEGVFKYAGMDRLEWIEQTLGMVNVLGSQVWWTWEVEDGFRRVRNGDKYAMKSLASKLTGQLNSMVQRVRYKLQKMLRKKLNTLLIIDVHARDIVDKFVRDSILDAREFAWESQLRFYWDRRDDDVLIRQCTGEFQYGYEYQGLNSRLVITPLTDRCYMTITQALTFKLGCSPAGPAGTGKTETVKDLSKGMALPCFVTNCGEGLDYRAMGSIFSGLVQVGAWGCFDEFNRINIEVLSVVSAQIKAIQNALNYARDSVDIGLGASIAVNRRVGLFITMNPGYAGRTELPDNLKALFRPVTMIVPDLEQICEIMLFSEGFEGARTLAKKMTVLYSLAKGQLSKQYHYDFGLRALKSVLVMAGSLKREYAEMPEDLVLMRALRDINTPKFVYEDVPLFQGLIEDLFPGLDCPRVSYPQLKEAVLKDMEAHGHRHGDTEVLDLQVDKCIQLYETIITRHTTQVVGPTGGGKSVVIHTLQRAMRAAFDLSVKAFVVNPKAQTVSELYGLMDPATRDWTDGILSKLFRDVNQPLPPGKENERRWVLFDGDVDAVWVEDMNSVMDDNRTLTLPNGERIRLQQHSILLIETFDLQYASPATISRCGMVYVDPKNLGYKPFFERWVRQRAEVQPEDEPVLTKCFSTYLKPAIDFVLEGVDGVAVGERLEQIIPITSLALARQLCNMMDAFIAQRDGENVEPLGEGAVEGLFVYALVWSVGASLTQTERPKFNEFLNRISKVRLPTGSVFDFYFDPESAGWEPWSTLVADYVAPSPFKFHQVFVPTKDSVTYTALLRATTSIQKPVLFVGESGTAKTVTIQAFLGSLDQDAFRNLNVNFSSRTTALDVYTSLTDSTDKRTGKVYGPPQGKQLAVFVDDLNMPKVDLYGTQQPIALLLFLIGRGHMYSREKDLDLRTYKDLLFFCAMGPPGGGRNSVDPRFISLFNVFTLTPPAKDVLQRIYSSVLSQFLEPFSDSVREVAPKITEATLSLFTAVLEKLPPTPAKFHYIFNLRDLSRLYEGLCLATPDHFSSTATFLRLWRNESMRVFGDRLTDDTDVGVIRKELEALVGRTAPSETEAVMKEPVLFGDFAEAPGRLMEGAEDPALYQDLGTYDNLREIFGQVLEAFNMEHKPMNLVLFQMALEHLTRIHRILRMPRGHALLVGVGGSGKQSLSKLAAFCAGHKVFEISLARNYGEEEFREDLKELYRMLGDGSVCFLFTDAHVLEEGFLELVNNMLTTGMVPALYEMDEKDAIISGIRKEVKAAGLTDTPDVCWEYYTNKCRDNLHIILAMSPSGDTLRVRCRNFPGMVSSTVIDWFFPWPKQALQDVANHFLREEPLPDEHREAIISHMVKVHQDVMHYAHAFEQELRRHYYVTPKNYLDFISNYRSQSDENKKRIEASIKRLEGGLTKLVEAGTAVDRMSTELTEKKKVVDAKTLDCEAMIQEIKTKSAIATESQEKAGKKQQELKEASAIIVAEKAKADESLKAALPALEAAAKALDGLDKKDITEIKAFATPPKAVMNVVLCVYHLKPTGKETEAASWKSAKGMMSDSNFLRCLIEYDKDKISSRQVSRVEGIFKKDPDLTMENMKSISTAGSGLLAWVVAIVKYYGVAKDVEPLRKKVRDMEKQQQVSAKELKATQAELAELEAQIKELSDKYEAANGELQQLAEQARLMERRLDSASKLITGLASERDRWTIDKDGLVEGRTKLVGDTLVAASFLSYVGAFTASYRQRMLFENWIPDLATRKVPLSPNLRLQSLLASDATVQEWTGQGLPADAHSVQNGMLTTRASRFPLCIDPQQQAVRWIKNKESGSNLTVRTFRDGDFMKHLELCIQYGNPFLFEGIDEELDPIIDPVLEKNTFKEGQQLMIKLGEQPIEWDSNFRLYLTTKLANPHYSPEVMGKTMIINYSVTMKGLENQLLNVVVGHERPDLEEQFSKLVEEMSENKALLLRLEDSLLSELASSKGNILDNEGLITTLEQTKVKATEIGAKLEESELTAEEINKTRSGYLPAAQRGSILYFAMAGLSALNKMYEISLTSFLSVFARSLEDSRRSGVLDTRIQNIVDKSTEDAYDYTCTGVFEKHKLMFSFQLACMIMEGDGVLNREELNVFLKGDTSLEAPAESSPYPWVSASGWKDLLKVGSLDGFEGLTDSVKNGGDAWRTWYDLESPEKEPLPDGFGDALSPFQQLLVVRCFRPDRVYNAVKMFVLHQIGERYVQPPVLDFHRIYAQSSNTTPIVFVLSPGADPQADIQELGDEMGFSGPKFKFLALGQGQGPLAQSMIENGMQRGHWVLLLNCHLLASWLKTLEKIVESAKKVHPDFRLWLTTDPTDKFPLGILQRSLKVVTEPPDGLKQNMRALYSKMDQSTMDECPHSAYAPLVYTLCFLHAVVLERRKYGKLGWNVPYDFNESDFIVSRKLLALYLNKALGNGDEMIPWGSLKYLIGEAMYGGRVSDDFDRRVLITYLDEYNGDFLFDENQVFYFSRVDFDYQLPRPGGFEHYSAQVELLPFLNSPAVFGLHPNAEIGYYTNAMKEMLSNLIDLQPRETGSGGGVSREDYIAHVASDILAKIPDPIDVPQLRKRLGVPTPEQVVLLQELERWNILVTIMADSLEDLRRALKGEIGTSDALDALADALFDGRIPGMWRRLAPDTEKPLGSWMAHFDRRHAQYRDWIEEGEPKVMWLSGLHIPESFLAAQVQSTCRRRNWPLDKSTLFTRVTQYTDPNEVPEKLVDGTYVTGLYLEGAGWDHERGELRLQDPKILVTDLPIIQVIPIEASKMKLQNTFKTPVYVTQARRNAMGVGLVFEADLATTSHPSHWVLQGVALCLNID